MKTRWIGLLLLLAAARAWAGEEEGGLVVRAVDASGRAIPRATALLAAQTPDVPWPVFAQTVELRDGAARFTASDVHRLASVGPLAVEVFGARDAGGAPLPLAPAFFNGRRPPSGTVSLRLGPGRRIEGTARDGKGSPLTSVDVIARPRLQPYSEPPTATSEHVRARAATDAAGRFVLEGLDERDYELWLVDRKNGGAVTAEPAIAVGGDARVRIVRDPRPPGLRALLVRVMGPDASLPAAVAVEFVHSSMEEMHQAEKGVTSFEAVPEEAYVRAYAAQDSRGDPLPWAPARVVVPAGAESVDVRMLDGLTVEGRVVDETGRPKPGMGWVAYDAGHPHGQDLGHLAWSRSEADGTFRAVGLGPEEVDLVVEATADSPASAPVRARGGDRRVVLTVRTSSPSRVRVLDEDARPVVGARFVVMQHRGKPGAGGASGVVVTTTADGTVDVPALDPTLHLSLGVEPPEARDDLSSLEVDPWKPSSGDVTLPRGFVATLKVLDEDGRPVKARVTKLIPPPRPWFTGGWTDMGEYPDDAGLLRVRGLPFGPTRFMAFPVATSDVFPTSSPAVEVNENRRTAELRIPTRGLSMTVRAEGAQTREHVGLLFADLGSSSMPRRRFDFEKDGLALLKDIAPGNYRVYVLRKPRGTGPVGRAEVSGFSGEAVRVAMGAPAALRVHVKAPPGTSDLTGRVLEGGEWIADLTSDGSGRLVCEVLPPGRYGVSLHGMVGKRHVGGSALVATGTETEIELVEAKD